MARRRLLHEFGMGSSLRRQDYTQAARRAVENALWHNSINLAELFGFAREAMIIEVEIGVQKPEEVDVEVVALAFPYGQVSVVARFGGLDVRRPGSDRPTVIANAVIAVSFDMEPV
ncbi:MAG: Lin0512 family protein [Pseudomonadota bacterium]